MTDFAERIAQLSPEQRELLLRRLNQNQEKQAGSEPIQRLSRETNTFPLSFSQERLWLLDQLEPGNYAYNIPGVIRLTGQLDLSALERTLNIILSRHDSLRTNFTQVAGQPVQIIAPFQPFSLPLIDLSSLSPQEKTVEADRLTKVEARQPFDLSRDLLMRAKLIRLEPDQYIFLLTMHHIVSDGWSMNIFAQEFAACYQALAANQPNPLPPLAIQYVDFAQWQRDWLQGNQLDRQFAYWKQQLAGDLPNLDILLDFPRPAGQSFNSGQEIVQLSVSLSQALKRLSQAENATLFMTLLAAFKLLLYRHTELEDIIVGSPVAGRNRVETENLIGFFLNTLVLRSDLSGNISFRELMKRVRQVAMDAYTHQDIPFEKLLVELRPERNLSRTPFFQVLFNMLNIDNTRMNLPRLTAEVFATPEIGSKFDFTIYVTEQDEAIKLGLVYNADLFTPEHMAELLAQYKQLLEQVVAAPDKSLLAYSLVTARSRHLLPDPEQVLTEPDYELVPQRLMAWAGCSPRHPAVSQDNRVWTYKELVGASQALAQGLLTQGLERGEVVAVCGSRSFGLIAGITSVLLSGGVLLTLDQNLPTHRHQVMLQSAKARRLLYVGARRPEDEWMEESLDIIEVEPDTGRPTALNQSGSPVSAPLPELKPDDAAYIFYTSGTTGVPKGILGCHKGLAHFLSWQRQTFAVGPEDRSAQLTGVSFDVVLRDIFLPLTSGATLCLPAKDMSLEPAQILPWLEQERISLLHSVPSLLQSWLMDVPAAVSLRRLRWLFSAGEPLPETLISRWRKTFPETGQIVNIYGPTETTLAKCFYVIPATEDLPGIQPVGSPLPETQALILTKNRQLCGINEPGEIVIRTPFRTLGYINAPDENAQRFVPNFFREDPQDLLYYTGDRGRYRPDGLVEILGRLDHQVKIRGIRIEPEEIGAILSHHPAVHQAVVVAREYETSEKSLVAYVVPVQDNYPTISDLSHFLRQRLPDYMIPSAFVLLKALPLTPNGKVNRGALPEPDLQLDHQATFIAPQTDLQELVAGIWATVLGLERVGIHDNFFELGGHSLLATQVMSRIRQALRVDLPLRTLFDAPTIALFVEKIQIARQDELATQTLPIQPVSRHEALPLSFSQERMWLIHQFQPNSSAYNMPAGVRLTGPLNLKALEKSFNELIRRHESLRTNFTLIDEQPTQVIIPPAFINLPVVDLRHLPAEQRNHEARRLAEIEAGRPFDLNTGPLLRLMLLQMAEEEHVLVLNMHHAISDAWSYGVVVQDLIPLYEAFCNNHSANLPELAIQYTDFAVWQREWLQGETLETQLDYWRRQLQGVSVLELPTDFPRPAVQTQRGSYQTLDLPPELLQALRKLSWQQGATLFMTLLTVFKMLLYRYTGQEDIVVGTPIANRRWLEIEGLIGTFVNTLAMRTNLSGNPTFKELLSRVREVALQAYTHQDMPFEKLVAELRPDRNTSYSPLVQVLFNVTNVPVQNLEFAGLKGSVFEFGRGAAQFDLTMTVADTEVFQRISVEYNTDLFEDQTITRLLGHFKTLLEQIVAGGVEQPVADFRLLTAAEWQQMIVDWNDTTVAYPHELGVHQLFEAQAEQTPEAIAVTAPTLAGETEQSLTYSELNRRANQLAHYLQKLGVGPEVYVGISLERSIEMVIGLLGILKAGGVYIPLDPAFPKDRRAFMLEDAQAPVLLSQRRLLADLPQSNAWLVCLDDDWDLIAQESTKNLRHQTTADNLAYILYTSGSTGKPKGVQIPHQALTNFLLSMRQEPGLTAQDILLSVTTLSFDIAGLELYLPLISGGQVVIVSREVAADGVRLTQKLAESGATILQATPVTWLMLLESGWAGNPHLKMLCGGEALPRDLADELLKRGGELWNMYGPTETTIWSTVQQVEPDRPITIGRPIANTQIYILNSNFQPVPAGIIGDLYIGGDGLARGYLNRPELTAEKFIRNPFSRHPHARMYKTGDLARFQPDGNVEFLGRLDHQVKLRGFRIELGEIEAVVRQHPTVQQAIVIAREDRPGDKRLVAYVVPQPDQTLITLDLYNFVKEQLPDYMIPSALVSLEALPLTPNNKVDRKALPAPDFQRLDAGTPFVAPRNPTEDMLAGIWAAVLGVEKVGIHENFFDLGGHSLLATQIVSRVRQHFEIDLPLRDLFENPTVAGLAASIEAIQWAATQQTSPQHDAPFEREEIEL